MYVYVHNIYIYIYYFNRYALQIHIYIYMYICMSAAAADKARIHERLTCDMCCLQTTVHANTLYIQCVRACVHALISLLKPGTPS